MRAAAVIAGALLLGVGPAPALAQRAFTVAPLVSLAEHRVDAGFGVERSLGPIVGGVGTVRLGPRLVLAVRALGGSLFGARGVLDRDVGELGAEGSVATGPWLALELGVTRRAYGTRLGRQTWTTLAAGATARVAFAGTMIHGVGHAALLPVVSVTGLPDPGAAFRAPAGLEYPLCATTPGVGDFPPRHDFPVKQGVRPPAQIAAM